MHKIGDETTTAVKRFASKLKSDLHFRGMTGANEPISSWLCIFDNYSMKRPRLSIELPQNPPDLCDAADDHPIRHGGTSTPSMDTLGRVAKMGHPTLCVISAATVDTPRSASLSAPYEGNILESASATGKPSTHGRLEQIRPRPTNGNSMAINLQLAFLQCTNH